MKVTCDRSRMQWPAPLTRHTGRHRSEWEFSVVRLPHPPACHDFPDAAPFPACPASLAGQSRQGTGGTRKARRGLALLCTFIVPSIAWTQATPEPASQDAVTCVEVTVDGQRVPPPLECLTRKLQPAPAQQADPHRTGAPLASEAITQRPANQLGLFNRAATGHRMGNQFGISAFPQRPPEAPTSSNPIPAPPAHR